MNNYEKSDPIKDIEGKIDNQFIFSKGQIISIKMFLKKFMDIWPYYINMTCLNLKYIFLKR
jgi:hypothetical protein